jgi:hypothetical protein
VKATPYKRLLFQLVPKVRPTAEIEFGSLLNTPTTQLMEGRKPKGTTGSTGTLAQQFQYGLLPTMRSRLTGDITQNRKNDKQRNLEKVLALHLLPTPNASDNRDRGSIENKCVQNRIKKGKQISLSMTINSKEAGRKLHPNFVEWMMGFPKDWTKIDEND